MKIYVQIKSAGKRRPIIEKVPYEISNAVENVQDFIREIVRIEVEKYNAKDTGEQLIAFLTNEEIDARAEIGKVGFDSIYSEKKADLLKAIENAMQCYKDGIVRVFQNDEELEELDGKISVKDGDVFTFMKLTFLAGRMW